MQYSGFGAFEGLARCGLFAFKQLPGPGGAKEIAPAMRTQI